MLLNHSLLFAGIAISDELDQVNITETGVSVKCIYTLTLKLGGKRSVTHHSVALLIIDQIKAMLCHFTWFT